MIFQRQKKPWELVNNHRRFNFSPLIVCASPFVKMCNVNKNIVVLDFCQLRTPPSPKLVQKFVREYKFDTLLGLQIQSGRNVAVLELADSALDEVAKAMGKFGEILSIALKPGTSFPEFLME